jgi:MFS family permease
MEKATPFRLNEPAAAEDNDTVIRTRRVLRKIDLRLLPIVVALHAISLVDRTNISVARISGMDEDLSLDTGARASIVTSTFFIGYILFNIPSNIAIRSVGAAHFLGTITVAWGAMTIGIGFVNSWIGAAVLRSFLGVFEAG